MYKTWAELNYVLPETRPHAQLHLFLLSLSFIITKPHIIIFIPDKIFFFLLCLKERMSCWVICFWLSVQMCGRMCVLFGFPFLFSCFSVRVWAAKSAPDIRNASMLAVFQNKPQQLVYSLFISVQFLCTHTLQHTTVSNDKLILFLSSFMICRIHQTLFNSQGDLEPDAIIRSLQCLLNHIIKIMTSKHPVK